MSRVRDLAASALGLLITGVFFLALAGVTLASHDACVSRSSGEVRHGSWGIDPLDWFAVATISDDEVCEGETAAMWLIGKVPVVGDGLERSMGGPSNPAYYEGN